MNQDNLTTKKLNIGLIIAVVAAVVVITIGILFGGKLFSSSKDNKRSNNGNSLSNVDVIYYDNKRELKDTYTFKEAVRKFAFKVNENTLIFEENDKVILDMATTGKTIYNELEPTYFVYKRKNNISLESLYLGESNSTSLEEFKTNFNEGVLSNNQKLTVENVNIIEFNDEYFFGSWVKKSITSMYEYYFAKVIGGKVYYAYHPTILKHSDAEISELLEEFKSLFNCLSRDDGKEPYIYDKMVNVPLVLNKKIKDVNLISGIINSNNGYLDGSVSLTHNSDYINLEYNAGGHYDKYDWSDTFNSNVKYVKDDGKDIIGIKDGDNTQIFEISLYSDNKITNIKEFNAYMSNYLIDK